MPALWLPLLLTSLVSGADPLPETNRIGVRIEDFSLQDHLGRKRRLSEWKERKAVVVVFLGVACPLAKLYGPRLAELARDYDQRGVAVIGIHANQHESADDLVHSMAARTSLDVSAAAGRRQRPDGSLRSDAHSRGISARSGSGVIRYHGRIDDQYDVWAQAVPDGNAARPHRLRWTNCSRATPSAGR